MRTHAEWKVLTHMILARPPTSSETRSRISAAALLVNVIARMEPGWALRSEISQAIRRVSTRVLPDPAPATTSNGAPSWTTARCWGSLSPARSSSFVGRRRRCGPPSASAAAAVGRPGIGNCMLMSGQAYGARPTRPDPAERVGISALGAERLPVLVDRTVGLREPDERAHDDQETGDDPEAGGTGHGLRTTAELLHLADL